MRIVLTKHAQKRMVERGISMENILEVVENPDYTIRRGELTEGFKKINSRNFKIVFEVREKFIKIITVVER